LASNVSGTVCGSMAWCSALYDQSRLKLSASTRVTVGAPLGAVTVS
jgi:hypothetical protein